jgi:uncharacterized membrane protein YeaQ/YmgE (transglycosylase-associated protein family)
MSLLWMLIVGGVIMGRDIPGGIIGKIIAGILGSWLGGMLLGSWGPKVSDYYVFPSLIGAVVLIFIVSLILRSVGGRSRS